MAQVRLSGNVTHQEMSLDQVSVKVIENGKILRTLAVSKKGRYETEIPFNKQYILTFSRPAMFPVSIAIDTRVIGDLSDVVYEVPLNMPMFYRFAGMDATPFKAVIGTIKKTGEDQLAFTFIPDPIVISALEPYQLESERRFMAREKPLYSDEEDTGKLTASDLPPKELAPEPSSEAIIQKSNKTQLNPKANPTPAGTEQAETEAAIEAQQRHFERSESSKYLNREQQQQQWQVEQSAKLQNEQLQLAAIGAEKAVKQEMALAREEEQASLSQSRVAQQARLSQLGVNEKGVDTSKPLNFTKATKIADYSVSEGIWLTEERILATENGATVEYKKQVYDWVFFEVTSFTRNGKEIDENKYEKIKALVRF